MEKCQVPHKLNGHPLFMSIMYEFESHFANLASYHNNVAIHPVFPRHVLFFRFKNSVWADFFKFGKMSGFFNKWLFVVILYKLNAFVTSQMFRFFTCDNSESWRLALSQRLLFKNLVKSRMDINDVLCYNLWFLTFLLPSSTYYFATFHNYFYHFVVEV